MLKTEQMTTLEKKIERFSRILGERPGDELTILALAEACFRRGLKLEALTAYQDVIGGRPVPEANLAVAEIYSAQGMPQEAYGELRQLFEVDPDNVEARLLVNTLQGEALPPADLSEIMSRPASDAAFEETRLRLKIQRSIYNRELQERTRNVTLEPGVVIHEYYVEEAKKKMIRVEELLRELQRYQEYSQTLSLEPRADAVSAKTDSVESQDALELDYALSGEADLESEPLELPDTEVVGLSEMHGETFHEESTSLEQGAFSPEDELEPSAEDSDGGFSAETSGEVGEPDVELASTAMSDTNAPSDTLADTSSLHPVSDFEALADASAASDDVSQTSATEPEELSETETPPSADPQQEEFLSEPTENIGSLEMDSVESVNNEYQPDFLESPLAPDLPDLTFEEEPLPEVPQTRTMIDLEPIEMGGSPTTTSPSDKEIKAVESPPRTLSAPTFSDAPVRPGPGPVPVAPIVVSLDSSEEPSPVAEKAVGTGAEAWKEALDEPTETAHEPVVAVPEPVAAETEPVVAVPEPVVAETEPVVSVPEPVVAETEPVVAQPIVETPEPVLPEPVVAAPEPAPPEPEPVVEAVPAAVETAKGLSAARKAFYQTHAEALSSLTTTLAKTRGVTSIYLVAREGMTIETAATDQISEKRIGDLVKESFEFLEAFAKDPAYWVLECGGGIFVMQKLDDRHVLIAIGQAGANFGALRYTMDKTRAKFEQILSQTPD